MATTVRQTHYIFVPSFGFLVVTGWEGPGLFVPATAAVSFLAAASVCCCWADLRVVIVVVEVRGFGEGARMGGERGLVMGGGEGEAWGEEGAARVLPGTKREKDTGLSPLICCTCVKL